MPLVRWKVITAAPPEEVWTFLATQDGREKFWAISAPDDGEHIDFVFANGCELKSKILNSDKGNLFECEYFGGSTAKFTLDKTEHGGTVVTVENDAAERHFQDVFAGWVSVLLILKAAVDHEIDLRNGLEGAHWDNGYVDQ